MPDRVIEEQISEIPEIPELLEDLLLCALEDAKEGKKHVDDVLVPFTMLAVKDNLFIEEHSGDSAEECYNASRHNVEHAHGADAYALCYEGYVAIDDDQVDAFIAEGGIPGADHAFAVGYLYDVADNGDIVVRNEPLFIGLAPNFMIATHDVVPVERQEEAVAESDSESQENE